MAILMFVNLKGGVAKTTNAVAVAECLADQKLRVLVIDADHQCMAGELLLGEKRLHQCEAGKHTLHDLLAAMLDDEFHADQLEHYVVPQVSNIDGGLEHLSLIPCSVRIDDFQTNMAKARRGYNSNDEFLSNWARRREAVGRYLARNYDFTIIDCPPSIALQVKMFLAIADAYVIPCVPDRLSVRGSLWFLDRVRRGGFRTVQPLGTLWSLYREQNAMHGRVIDYVERGVDPYGQLPKPFQTVIPNATAIAESTEPDQSPKSFSAKYSTKFARLYRDLCEEIVQRYQWGATPSQTRSLEAAK